MQIGRLTDNQFFMLDAVAAGLNRASMAPMRFYIEETHGKDISLGRQVDILNKFEQAGWVTCRWSEPGKGRGQRRKKLYTITGEGQKVLSLEQVVRSAVARAGLAEGVS